MKPADNIERVIRELRVQTSAELDQRILSDALRALEHGDAGAADSTARGGLRPLCRSSWRRIMQSNWIKPLAAAAAIGIVAILFATLHRSAQPAYALEQTMQANRGLRFVHIRFGPAGEVVSETWAQIDEQGQVVRLKMALNRTEDGPKVVLWEGDKAEVWFKDKRIVGVHRDSETITTFANMLREFEPVRVIEELYRAQAEGRVAVETSLPVRRGDPITLTATTAQKPGQQTVYLIDAQTKLLQRREVYEWDGRQHQQTSRWDYLDYNQEPAEEVFTLGAPADTVRIDHTTQLIGLPKGTLSDAQITVQLAREFFEALIAGDHARAGQLLSGLPAERVPEILQKLGWDMKFLRIVSIGEPVPQPVAGVGGTEVTCQVEVEVNGVPTIRTFTPAIRAVSSSQPERWAIHGGT